MNSFGSLLLWYSYLGIMLIVIQRYTRCLTELNVFTLFVGFFVLRHGVTVPFDDDVNEWFAGIVVSDTGLWRFHSALYLMWAGIAGGIILGRLVIGSARAHVATPQLQVQPRQIPTGVNALFLPSLLISLILLLIFQLRLDSTFLRMVTGALSADEYRAMRDSLGQSTHYSINAFYRISSIVRFGLLPFYIYTLYFLRNRSFFCKFLFWSTLIVGLLLGVSSGQKTPAIFICIGLVIAWCYERGLVKIRLANYKLWLLIAFALFWVLPSLYRLQYAEQGYAWRLRATFFRLSSEYDRSLQLYFEIYPDIEPYLYGKSSSLIVSLVGLDMPQEKIPERFIPIYYLGENYQNTWNAAFPGVAWADFGYLGVVCESVMAGLLLYAYYLWFSRLPRTASSLGLQVAAAMAATKMSEVSFTASLLSFGLLTSVIAFIILRSRNQVRV